MLRVLIAVAVAIALGALILLAPFPQQDVSRVRNSIDIAAPAEQVFEYVTTPRNWPRWHPSSRAVHGAVDHSLQVGERVTEDFTVAGREGQVVWTVAECVPPSHWKISGQIDSRPAGTVQYDLADSEVAPTKNGTGRRTTHFVREFDYGAPNLLFSILNRLTLRERIESESAAAVQGLKRELEQSSAYGQ
jgi:hypothetical protein